MMDAGRELDALVAEKVMGFTIHDFQYPRGGEEPELDWSQVWKKNGDTFNPIHYSTDIAAAWQVMETLRRGTSDRVACCIELIVTDEVQPNDCLCRIFGPNTREVVAMGNSMPLAICLAALKMVGQ